MTSVAPRTTEPKVSLPLPGPASRALLERQAERESNARTYPRRLPIAVKRGVGSYIEDLDGNVFIDFLTGAGVLGLGHNHPEVVEAVRRQLDDFCHGLDLPTEIKDEFTTLQLSLLPESMQQRTKIQFCGPTGANAVDAALKLCKTATGRSDVVAFSGAFHGSTHAAMAVTGWVGQKEPVANNMHGVHFFPYPYPYRWPITLDPGSCAEQCLHALESALKDPLGGITKPAAVIMEPVQAEGGVIVPPREFVQGVRELTRELEIPLILDEIQTGCGRTGTWFAFEQFDIEPDVILASKGLGGIGMPIAIVMYDGELDTWGPGAHTATFRGNQLAFAAGVASARIIQRDGILEHVRREGEYVLDELRALQAEQPAIGDVRGLGLMIGFEMIDPETGAADGDVARRIQRLAVERGLILELGGRYDAVVRMLPPLNVSRETLDQALEIVREAVAEACAQQ
jgi:diaminobutyrate-2-oxoglutarate transaminase